MPTLAEIDLAIKDINDNGQSFTLDDLTYSAANMSALVTLREQIKVEESRTNGTRPTFRAFKFGSMGY